MSTFTLSPTGEVQNVPSATSSNHDFDFIAGKWKAKQRKLKSRLTGCDEWIEFETKADNILILDNHGTFDRLFAESDGKPFEGATLRVFNPETRLWSIYWAATNMLFVDAPTVGSFDGPIGRFFCNDVHAGKPVLCQFIWDKTDLDNPVWSQALSEDNGETWEWNWYAKFERVV